MLNFKIYIVLNKKNERVSIITLGVLNKILGYVLGLSISFKW